MNSKKIIALILASILSLTALVACGNTQNTVVGLSSYKWACEDDEVMFNIDGEDISFADFRYFAMNMKTSYEGGVENYWNENTESKFREDIINNFKSLIATKLLCEEKGLTFTEADQIRIDNELLQIEIEMSTKGFNEQLDLIFSDKEHYKELVKFDIYNEKLYSSYVTDKEIIDAVMRAKHVLVSTVDENGNPLSDDKLKEKDALANDIYAKAIAGENFDELIKTYGEDPGMTVNVDGYYFTEGEMVPEFENATKALAENAISQPVKTNYGYHIIQRLPVDEEYVLKRESGFPSSIAYALKGQEIYDDIQKKADTLEVTETEAFNSFDMYTIGKLK